MPGTRATWVVLAWICAIPALAFAQERRELSLGSGEAPVSVFADRLESLERDNLLIADGEVEIEQGEIRLEADRAEINTETAETVAVGRVVFFDGRDRLVGERLEYNFRTGTGIVYRAEAFAEPHFFFAGSRMERFGEKAYRLTGGTFTTCDTDPPAWHVRWGRATAYLDDYVWGTNASFWVWKLPLVPFLPIFGASLRKDRHTGFLLPTLGASNTKGFTFRQPFFWAISDSQDLLLLPTYYEKRGLGLGAAYRYVRREESRGEIEGFVLNDTETDKTRWVIGLRHEEQITPRLSLKADLAQVSDDQYFSEFGDTLDERSRQRLESNLSLTQRWEKWNLVARLFTYEDLTTKVPIELNRLPDIRVNAFQQPLFGGGPVLPPPATGTISPVPQSEHPLSDLLFEVESSYTNFVRDVGSEGQRLDLHPRFFYPFRPGGYFTVTPRIGGRETIYDTKVVGTKVERDFLVEDTRNEFVNRSLFEGGMDLEARAYRVFDMGGMLDIQRIQHVIEPRVSYNYIPEVNQDDLPQFDAIDKIRGTNGVTYSLTNRVKAREVGTEERPGRVWELLRLTFSQTYDLDRPPLVEPVSPIGQPAPVPTPTPTPTPTPGTAAARRLRQEPTPTTPTTPTPPGTTPTTTTTTVPRHRLSDLIGDLLFEPVFGLRFRGTAAFNPYEQDVRNATTDASYETRDWRLSFGTRHGEGGRLQFIQGDLQARLGARWSVRLASNYSVDTSTVIENRVEVEFREQCWAVSVALVDRTNEDEFRITINLLELGHYGFGRAFASQ